MEFYFLRSKTYWFLVLWSVHDFTKTTGWFRIEFYYTDLSVVHYWGSCFDLTFKSSNSFSNVRYIMRNRLSIIFRWNSQWITDRYLYFLPKTLPKYCRTRTIFTILKVFDNGLNNKLLVWKLFLKLWKFK